jgi:hypothetical protein
LARNSKPTFGEGENEDDRTADLRHFERIKGVAWVIREAKTNPEFLWYENKRGSGMHVILWFRSPQYNVILAKRTDDYLFKSAYLIKPHREKFFEKEYCMYWGKS